jgi:hypothetical protein
VASVARIPAFMVRLLYEGPETKTFH